MVQMSRRIIATLTAVGGLLALPGALRAQDAYDELPQVSMMLDRE